METLHPPASSFGALRPDGRRVKLHPSESTGRFTRLQRLLYPALIAVYAALPWVRVQGRPLVLVDLEHRRFFLFGLTFNSTDFYLAFFALSGLGFALIVLSALFGRVWCGYACPQTVFLEGVYRRIEALVEGRSRERVAREQAGWTAGRAARAALKHALFFLVSLALANLFLSYFATADQVLRMVRRPPSENWEAFLWVAAITGALHFNFGWFREQLCLVVCPYGRLQSVLADPDTVVVGYDARRGEPRARRGTEGAGACVDCRRCVQVCPTGIDIRNGLQLDCIGCAHCVEACDQVMIKIGREPGLIRYDSSAGLAGQPRRFWRPRVAGYAAALLAGALAFAAAARGRQPFEATLLRAQQTPYEREGGLLRNRFVLHVASKSAEPTTLRLEVSAPPGAEVILPGRELRLEPFESRQLPLIIEAPTPVPAGARQIRVRATDGSGNDREVALALLGA